MSNITLGRLKWACRRGMLELDLILIPFIETYFNVLSQSQKEIFVQLLEYPDPDIFNWLMGYSTPEKEDLAELVTLISHVKN